MRRHDNRSAKQSELPMGQLVAASTISTVQINLGYECNRACRHCHLECSPSRTGPQDNMDRPTARRVVEWVLRQPGVTTVDLTGGSPELNDNFRWMVVELVEAGLHVIDRCNPSIISHFDRRRGRQFSWLPEFLARYRVEVVSSLPCYLRDNVDRQRGKGAFDTSIAGLLRLNDAGYGRRDDLVLNLVYNPDGAHLPPKQAELEAHYRRALSDRFGLSFTNLWTMTNVPIGRWRQKLARTGELASYQTTLRNAYNPSTVPGLMCRHQICVGPDGRVFDCDFHHALGTVSCTGRRGRVWHHDIAEFATRPIEFREHCLACTAGPGSSCGGALDQRRGPGAV